MLRIFSNKPKLNYYNNKHLLEYQNYCIKKKIEVLKNKPFLNSHDCFKIQNNTNHKNNLELIGINSPFNTSLNTYGCSIFLLLSIISSYIFYNYNKLKN